MTSNGKTNPSHQQPESHGNPRLMETEDMLHGLGLDANSMSAIKAIADEIIEEHITPSMPWPDGCDGLMEDKEDME